VASARRLVDYWVEGMSEDLFYLLDEPSKQWIRTMLDKLGRRVLVTDSEGNSNGPYILLRT
jgi:hypothetical protein